MNLIIFILIIFIIYYYKFYYYNNNFKILYKKENFNNVHSKFNHLMKNFDEIFLFGNRNAGGAQYFKFIYDLNLNKNDFLLYNTFYCSVSGSPIDPIRNNKFINVIINDIHNNKIFGQFYKCCSPCICDIIKYTKVEKINIKLKDGNHQFYAIVIGDPCIDLFKIPIQVSAFKCKNKKTINGIHTKNNNLIIGILHNARKAKDNDLEYLNTLNQKCQYRNSKKPNELIGGMGDIFVKLASINKI